MLNKLRFLILATILMCSASELPAQEISIEEFFSSIQEGQNQIDLLRQGMADSYAYFELETLESAAYSSPDPQAFLDYFLARYHWVNMMLNKRAGEYAEIIAEYIRVAGGSVDLNSVVISEGIAKYTDMQAFFAECANEQESQYNQLWQRYLDKYQDPIIENLMLDNEFLKRYGAGVLGLP